MRNIYNTVNNNKKDKGRWGQPARAESRGTEGRLDLGLPQRCREKEGWFQEIKGGKLSQRKDTPLPEARERIVKRILETGDPSRATLEVWADDSRGALGKEPRSRGHAGAEPPL